MSVPSFQGLPLADRDRKWDGAAAEKRARSWAKATEEPNGDYHNAHVWYDAAKKGNFTADQLLIADVVKGELLAVPARSWLRCGDAGLAWWRQPPERDIERVGSHLARYYAEMDGHGALG